jgi:hypothetical protein
MYTSGEGCVDSTRGCAYEVAEVYGNYLFFLLSISVNLKLLQNNLLEIKIIDIYQIS